MTNENQLPAADAAELPQEPAIEEGQHATKARRGRRKPAEPTAGPEGPDVFDEAIAAHEAGQAERERRATWKREPGDLSARRHPNLRAIAIDAKAGIRLEEEEKRVPGQTVPRLLLTFDDDKKPSKEESKLLHDEGLRFDGTIGSWWIPVSAQNRLLAEHAYNGVQESRGFEPQIAVPAR
jgi:hypothetical protein